MYDISIYCVRSYQIHQLLYNYNLKLHIFFMINYLFLRTSRCFHVHLGFAEINLIYFSSLQLTLCHKTFALSTLFLKFFLNTFLLFNNLINILNCKISCSVNISIIFMSAINTFKLVL